MTRTPPAWEPPISGTPTEHLVGALDRMRATFRWKADGLDADGLSLKIGASALTIGGLLKHLTGVEDVHFTWHLDGSPPSEPWRSHDWEGDPAWDFRSAGDDTPSDLYAAYDDAVARSQRVLRDRLADGGLEQPIKRHDGEGNFTSLGRMVADLVEEYGRHTGHADLLREAVDGRVGEDPPWDWAPPYQADPPD